MASGTSHERPGGGTTGAATDNEKERRQGPRVALYEVLPYGERCAHRLEWALFRQDRSFPQANRRAHRYRILPVCPREYRPG